ncbi:hypothetical protein OF83DRAFT_1156781, partial [Amylostereum chailletii]
HLPRSRYQVILNILGMLSYTRSHRWSCLAGLWAIYLKTCGLSSRAFDALHATGMIMSIKWTTERMDKISDIAMVEVVKIIREQAFVATYDNVNIPMRVFSQRSDKNHHFYSGCSGMIWVLPKDAKLTPDMNADYQKQRREGAKEPFSLEKMLAGQLPRQAEGDKRIEARTKDRILRFLLNSPPLINYEHRDDPVLSPPPPVELLPSGPDNITHQFILQTADIEEASYEGNLKVLQEWLHEREKLSQERLIAFIGDQLTVDRLRGLIKFRHEDKNSDERLDWILPVFGWLHLLFALAASILDQFCGMSAGPSLQRAFDLLNRKGLQKTQAKGPHWHHLDEALWHVGEGLILACWIQVAGVDKLDELTMKTPEELALLAEEIYDQFASRAALEKMARKKDNKDEVKFRTVMFIFDVLLYFDLREVIKSGDVGRMEDLLPDLLLRFAGGGNPKYKQEVMELIQALQKELTPEMR